MKIEEFPESFFFLNFSLQEFFYPRVNHSLSFSFSVSHVSRLQKLGGTVGTSVGAAISDRPSTSYSRIHERSLKEERRNLEKEELFLERKL